MFCYLELFFLAQYCSCVPPSHSGVELQSIFSWDCAVLLRQSSGTAVQR